MGGLGAGRRAAHTLERYLAALATIASAAPLLGLLGTVIGMIEIFGSQAGSGGVANAAGGNPAQLAQGISIALYNTAFGLIVAIYALVPIAALAGDEFKIKEVMVLATLLAALSYFAFIWGLKLQFPVWPSFLIG